MHTPQVARNTHAPTITRHNVGTVALKLPVAESLMFFLEREHFKKVLQDESFVALRRADLEQSTNSLSQRQQGREQERLVDRRLPLRTDIDSASQCVYSTA